MSLAFSASRHACGRRGLPILLTIIAAAAATSTAGCGGGAGTGGTSPGGPVLTGNTTVTVVLSSTANDQLTEFDLGIQSITLTNKSGKTVSLVSALQGSEYMHLNGGIEPLIAVSIPQDIYTSATATIGGAQFTCVELIPGSLATSTYAYGQTPSANVTVNLPAPITVTGSSMGLSLNLLVAQSAAYSACYSNGGIDPYSITPTFNLTPVVFSSQPTSPSNGKVIGFNGQVSTINTAGGSFVLSLPALENGRSVSVSSASATAYQGINNFSDLAVGTFVNMDGAIQRDGSLLATRVAVEDTTATTVVTPDPSYSYRISNPLSSCGAASSKVLFTPTSTCSAHKPSASRAPHFRFPASSRICRSCLSHPASPPPTWCPGKTSTSPLPRL